MSSAGDVGGADHVYETLETYDWDNDVEFQAGLSAILGTNSTPEQIAELTLRARCFYYSRCVAAACFSKSLSLIRCRKHNVDIDFDAYKAYHTARAAKSGPTNGVPSTTTSTSTEAAGGILPTSSNPNEPSVPYPSSFAHIVELVTTGQPIPGIMEIPDTVLTGQGTQPAKPKRRKPWEKDDASATQSAEHGTTA